MQKTSSPSINGDCHILADFLGEPCCQLATGVELSADNQVWQVVFALMAQTIKQLFLAVNVECHSYYAKSDDFQIGKLGNYTTIFSFSTMGQYTKKLLEEMGFCQTRGLNIVDGDSVMAAHLREKMYFCKPLSNHCGDAKGKEQNTS